MNVKISKLEFYFSLSLSLRDLLGDLGENIHCASITPFIWQAKYC